MIGRRHEEAARSGGRTASTNSGELSTKFTGSFTPSPAPPPPFTAACFSRQRGGLTTNGLHLSLPLKLSNGSGPPQIDIEVGSTDA